MQQTTRLTIQCPSVIVSLQLLADTENFFLNRAPKILEVESEFVANGYSIALIEPNTETKFTLIAEYQYALLPEKTEKITQGIEINSWITKNGTSFKAMIYFSQSKWASEIKIDVASERSDLCSENLKTELLKILSHYKTLNSLFHPRFYVSTILLAILSILAYLWFTKIYYTSGIFITVWLILMVVLYGEKIKPYSLFDTNKNKIKDRVVNWVLLALIAGVLIKVFINKVIGI